MSAVYWTTLVRWASAVGDGGVSRFFTRSLKPRRTSAAPLTEMNTNYYPKKHLEEEEEEYEPIATSPCLPPKTSPWLILPPTSKSGDMFYNFYSLSEAKVKSYSKRRILMDESDDDDAYKIVGSSHGWLALFNNRNNDLFLSNPLLSPGQQVKLPPVDTLPEPSLSRDGHATISKVIISCSPYDTRRRCVAVMTYGPTDQLAFCLPGLSTKWTPVLDPYSSKIEHPFITYSIIYDDIVCRPTRDSSISFIQSFFWVGLEDWETLDPTPTEVQDWSIDDDEVDGKTSLSFGFTRNVILRGEKCRWWLENEEVVAKCLQIPHLVVYAPTEEDEKKHRFFFVLRFLMPVRPDGNYDDGFCGWSGFVYRLKTVGFCLFELDDSGLDWKVVEKGSLDGLAMFVGINHSFALSAHDFPELEPNSIYYTHPHQIAPKWESNISDQDVGIFDYENKTFHPWFDIGGVDQRLQGIGPPLMWFTPNN